MAQLLVEVGRGLHQELQKRRIKNRENADQLRWGYGQSGNFNIKEVASLVRGDQNSQVGNKWTRLWNLGLWPKITLFLWLLLKGRILTWDNLKRRGLTGPSRCVMCNEVEETMDHLLNQCNWAKRMWREGLESFQQTRQEPGSIQDIIISWESKPFKNPIVKRPWDLLLDFTA